MARIQVNEKDMSWYYRTRDPGVLTVLTPVLSTWGPLSPTLVDFNNFKRAYGDPVDPDDLSYPVAYSLAKSGITILGMRINLLGTKAGYTPGTITDAKTQSPFTIEAKYTGTYGNKILVSCKKYEIVKDATDTNIVRFQVYFDVKDTSGTPLETLVYEFVDRDSAYYYTIVNKQTQYVEITPPADISDLADYFDNFESDPTTKFSSGIYFQTQLTGGTDCTTTDTRIWSDGAFKFDEKTISEYIVKGGLGYYPAGTGTQEGYDAMDSQYADLRDPYTIDFDVAISGGYCYVPASGEGLFGIDGLLLDYYFISLVKSRGTAIYLVDSSKGESAEDFYTRCGKSSYDTYVFTRNDSDLNIEGIPIPADYSGASSYVAAYGPWCYAQLLANGRVRELPGSYVMLTAWARSLTSGNPAYLAPAGVKRASLGKIVVDTEYPVGSAVIDAWQNHDWYNTDAGYKVNPIARLRSYGYVVYGNSTLLKADSVTGATSMLQSLSTRIVANLIKRRAFDISLRLQFDQIDDDIFASFSVQMGTFMDELKYGGALYDYRIVANYSDMTYDNLNQRTIPVKILISPNPAAENFIIDLEIHPAGVTFGDDTQQNVELPLQ